MVDGNWSLVVPRLKHFDRGVSGAEIRLRYVSHQYLGPGSPEISERVEPAQQALGHMKFLGKLRQRARVRKTRKLRHLFQVDWNHLRERSGDVGVGDRVGL